MHHFIFRCPVTTASVQGSCRNDPCPGPYYVAQHCTACGGLHLVNPLTGKLLAVSYTHLTLPTNREV